MKPVIVHDAAEYELRLAIDFYEAIRKGLGLDEEEFEVAKLITVKNSISALTNPDGRGGNSPEHARGPCWSCRNRLPYQASRQD
jgi:hypothetical protein